ncbi:MAG: hypothetical protein H6737_20315 [Alphaproteobacteria bacterium]|nr:hypothetical protein [Alphaproteobacteria bacterium]
MACSVLIVQRDGGGIAIRHQLLGMGVGIVGTPLSGATVVDWARILDPDLIVVDASLEGLDELEGLGRPVVRLARADSAPELERQLRAACASRGRRVVEPRPWKSNVAIGL